MVISKDRIYIFLHIVTVDKSFNSEFVEKVFFFSYLRIFCKLRKKIFIYY